MDRLEQIKNEVSRENGYKSFNDMMWTESHVSTVEVVLRDVARRYATEVARHNLERAAESAKVLVSNGESTLDVKSWTLDDGTRFSPDYRRITSLEIELI